MKNIILSILFLCMICFSSCKSEKESKPYNKVWTVGDVNEINKAPVSAVWIKPWINGQGWFPYKTFDSIDELREIIHCLTEPEQKRDGQPFTGMETLVIYYPPPKDPIYVSFYLDEWGRCFETEGGFSRKLYKILMEKERRAYFGTIGPFQELNFPLDIIWIKKNNECKWVPYKSFNSFDERIEIHKLLLFPENRKIIPTFVGDQILVIYYPPFNPMSVVSKPTDIIPSPPKQITFSTDDSNQEIITKNGRSRQLFKLFTEKKEREDFFHSQPK